MIRRSTALVQALMFCLTYGCSRSYAQANFEKQATALLLQRFETVVSARSSVLSRLDFDHPNQNAGRKYLGLPFVYLIGGLRAVGPDTLAVVEGGSDTVLTGSKDFVGPEGLGMVSSRSCNIAILAPDAALNIAREFSKTKVESIDGRPVWTWSLSPSEGYKTPTRFYAAVVTSSFFVLSNNRDDFRETANSLATPNRQTDVVIGSDVTSLRDNPYWAYRAIRRSQADSAASGLSRLPASAVKLKLFTKFDDAKVVFEVLAQDNGSVSAPKDLPSSELMSFRQAGAGVWRAEIPLTALQTTSALFQVLSFFGYGVVL